MPDTCLAYMLRYLLLFVCMSSIISCSMVPGFPRQVDTVKHRTRKIAARRQLHIKQSFKRGNHMKFR